MKQVNQDEQAFMIDFNTFNFTEKQSAALNTYQLWQEHADPRIPGDGTMMDYLPAFSADQLSKVPDKIEHHSLSEIDKRMLLSMDLIYSKADKNISYYLFPQDYKSPSNEQFILYKDSPGIRKSVPVAVKDIGFNMQLQSANPNEGRNIKQAGDASAANQVSLSPFERKFELLFNAFQNGIESGKTTFAVNHNYITETFAFSNQQEALDFIADNANEEWDNYKIIEANTIIEALIELKEKGIDMPSAQLLDRLIQQGTYSVNNTSEHSSQLKIQTDMNIENLEFLKNQVKYLGFDEALAKPIEDAISKGLDKFTLESAAPWKTQKGNDVVFDLAFSKGSNENERYFLNSYKAEVRNPTTKEPVVSQDFHVNYTKGITSKEAFNLLEGRAVYKTMENKDHEKFNAWVQLNPNSKDEKGNMKFAMYNDNYGFDLSNAMKNIIGDNYQFKQSTADAAASLKKGNMVELVPMAHVENKASYYASANPQYKTLNVFDGEGNKQFVDNTRKNEPAKSVGADIPVAVEEKKQIGVKR